MKGSSVETSVGIFVLIGIVCVGYLTIKLGKMEWIGDNHYLLYARFESVSGLRPGANVEIAGVRIGQIDSISPGSGKAGSQSNAEDPKRDCTHR